MYIVTAYLYCVSFVLLGIIIVTFYFSLLHSILLRCAPVSVGILLKFLSLSFFRRLIFPDSNDNIWQVKNLRSLVNALVLQNCYRLLFPVIIFV